MSMTWYPICFVHLMQRTSVNAGKWIFQFLPGLHRTQVDASRRRLQLLQITSLYLIRILYQLQHQQQLPLIFFLSVFFFSQTLKIHGTPEKGGDRPYSLLAIPPPHDNSDIYLQVYIWDHNHVFFFTAPVIIRLLVDEAYPALRISVWLNVNCNRSCCSNFLQRRGVFKLWLSP